ncbi:Ger(x)C family spore germination C-terminal domain-containing protein [Brevibacillus agri]|uniref:Ger(x)C family spore germination C-terminal domain-containing protein n=1 Tax=Brevibacillus agri TaxID=51101 RepID=UPI0009DD25B8|nr:Ger(x)C family spore germination C-terminal domain-containing protein [Brevibacillus agri]
MWEAYRDIHASTADMAVPIIKAGTETLFDNEGSAIFHSDKMVGTISTDETFLYNLFRDRFTTGIVEVTPSASLQIVNASISHETSWQKDKPHISSTLHIKAIVSEADETKGLDTEDLKRELDRLLEMRFRKLFESVQKQRADILMTGVIFRSKLSPDQIATASRFGPEPGVVARTVSVPSRHCHRAARTTPHD